MAQLRMPLTIPTSLQATQNYKIQLSIYSPELDKEIFMETLYKPSDLTATANGGYAVVLNRASMPRFREPTQSVLRAHFWKGSKLVGTEDLGTVGLQSSNS
jgi:hypothetical protein